MRGELKAYLNDWGRVVEGRDLLEVWVDKEKYFELVKNLKEEERFAFNFLTDLTCVDGLSLHDFPKRFCVVTHLHSFSYNERLRLKVFLDENELSLSSLTPLYRAADWLEREVYDMFGVHFEGHPDLRRILLYEEFEGHPLRKDYPVDLEQPRVPLKPVVEAGTGRTVRAVTEKQLLHEQREADV